MLIKNIARKRMAILRISIILIITFIIIDNNFSAFSLNIDMNTSLLFSYIGFSLVVLGGFGRIWASLYLEGFKTRKLIKEGPYSMVRNPLYFFSLMLFLGMCFAIKSIAVSFALLIVFVLLLMFFAILLLLLFGFVSQCFTLSNFVH